MDSSKRKLNTIIDEDSIYILNFVKKIWENRQLVSKVTIYSFLLGVIIALISPTIFESKTSFVPQVIENSSSVTKNLSSLADITGIDLGAVNEQASMDKYLSPLLYFSIIESEEFPLKLLNENLIYLNGEKLTVKEYLLLDSGFSLRKIIFKAINFIKKYTIGLFISEKKQDIPNEIANKYTFISEDDYKLIEAIRGKFIIEVIKKDGYIKVLAYDENPFISTQLVKIITKNLQSSIIRLRTNKIKNELDYSKDQYFNKKSEFEKIQKELAIFRDSNKNISTALFASQLQILQSEYFLQEKLLTSLAGEYNNNKIKLSKNTPIFSVLDEVSVPSEKHKPKRTQMVLIFTIIGFIFSSIYILTKDIVTEIINFIK